MRTQRKYRRRRRSPRRGQDGFSLIDLMVGVALAVFALGAVFMTTQAAGQLRRVDRETTLAFHACRKRMEELRDVAFNQLAAQNNTTFDVDLNGDSVVDLKPPTGAAHAGSVIVTVQDSSGGDTLYKVVVQVRWQGVSGTRSTSLTSLIGNRRGT